MPAPTSVIIPTLNAAEILSATLDPLVEGVEAGLIRELIITDGGSQDETCRLADAWGADVVRGPASRGGQLRRGCAQAQGDWILVLRAGTRLSPGWSGPVAAHLSHRTEAGYFALRCDRGGHLVAAWANLRARLLGLPYGVQGLLISRALYDAAGGYRDIPRLDDVALARALRGRLRAVPSDVIVSAADLRRRGGAGRGFRNLWLLMRYFAGAAPERLARRSRP